MSKIPQDYLQKVYAGWLGKVIGIRHGAPIESMVPEQIVNDIYAACVPAPDLKRSV